MSSWFDPQRQESLKMVLQERRSASVSDDSFKHYKLAHMPAPLTLLPPPPPPPPPPLTLSNMMKSPNPKKMSFSGGFDVDDLQVAAVIPPVTVVLEGRSICQRISLHKHASYQTLARALRQMFVEQNSDVYVDDDTNLDLSNAVPGHIIAYEDMENDLLLVGDLNWKDFVRVAKRIRILPVKAKSRNLQQIQN